MTEGAKNKVKRKKEEGRVGNFSVWYACESTLVV